MKNKPIDRMRVANNVILIGIGLGALYWVLESAMHAFVFHKGSLVKQILAPDPTRIWIRSLVVCLLIIFAIYVQFTINRRKRAEEALRESEENFRALAENAIDGIMIVGAEGTHVYANKRAAEITGYSVTELLKTTIKDLAHPYEFKKVMERYQKRLEGQPVPRQYETVAIRKDGKSVPIELAAGKTVWQRQPADMVIFRDITERKKAEEEKEILHAQLLQSKKMEAIGILASGIAHDFNNLLGAIQGYTELAKERVDKADPLYSDLERIDFAAERGASLTSQLLLFCRKQPLEPTPLNINKMVVGLSEMLGRLISEDIAINIDLEPDLWTVRADEASIEQLIMNLAVNAKEAMPKGGELAIKTENVTLDEEKCKAIPEARPGDFICLSVADTGVGMDEEIRQHIFEPFFTTKEPGKRAGLGLSVVYGIVKEHEGWINVYSEPGKGSTFQVYLPALP